MKRLCAFLVTCGVLMLSQAWGPLGARLAEAQGLSVKLSLTSPAGGPSATIFPTTDPNDSLFPLTAKLTKDGAEVGRFEGTLVVSGGTASIGIPVTALPNAVEFWFAVPFGVIGLTPQETEIRGKDTKYSVPPEEFAFDTRYFLPNPSPGGTVPPDTVGDPSTDASVVLRLVQVEVDDTTPPTCQVNTSEPGVIKFTVQDVGSGINTITVSWASNADVVVPIFTPGTTAPVVVTATTRDPTRTTSVSLKVTDVEGNSAICKSTVLRRVIRRERHWGN